MGRPHAFSSCLPSIFTYLAPVGNSVFSYISSRVSRIQHNWCPITRPCELLTKLPLLNMSNVGPFLGLELKKIRFSLSLATKYPSTDEIVSRVDGLAHSRKHSISSF